MEHTISSVIDQKIADIKAGTNAYGTGRVRLVREYIVEATGLDHAAYFERVTIGDHAEGYVDAVRQDSVLIALTRMDEKSRSETGLWPPGRSSRHSSLRCPQAISWIFSARTSWPESVWMS